jgi:tRNA-2-methylthio-N6-dimethylallyladenosine synthase
MASSNIEFNQKNNGCDTDRLRMYIENRSLKYLIKTYGCQMNQHDSEKLAGILQDLTCTPAADVEDADIILFNTCCVREHAEHKVFGNVGALKKLKSEKPSLIIGVCGCTMQQENAAKHLMGRFPFIDFTFGTQNSGLLPDMLCRVLFEKKRVSDICQLNDAAEDRHIAREKGPLAWVNIMYGCDNFCSYCIVPFVRGRERSRQPDDIVREVQRLSEAGYREATLLGQNVNSYGRDLGTDFPRLLQRLNAETNIDRIRFMTSHPKDLSDDLIDTIASCSRVCKQVHLPMQSGSSAILESMNRRYTREDYFHLVHKLRQRMPDVGLSTDIIVGFPSETEGDFHQTLDMIQSIRFDSAYTFIFSKRSGTAAAKMENQITSDVKHERIGKLIELQKSITLEKNRDRIGQTYKVLVESESKDKRYISGRNDAGLMINFKGDPDLIGGFVSVMVTDVSPHTLFGELV